MTIATNLTQLKQRIQLAAKLANRDPADIKLLAVSKTRSQAEIAMAIAAGQTCFGENYLQEALPKIIALQNYHLEWHFIGAIQANKTRKIAEHFAWVQSLDNAHIAKRLSEQRPAYLPPLNVCIQININDEASKSGVLINEVDALAKAISDYPKLRLRGLMVIPKVVNTPAQLSHSFKLVREKFLSLQQQGFELDTLSMGMSQDLELAIVAGATMVRVGKDVFTLSSGFPPARE